MGGFNWLSQHLEMEVLDGTATEMDGDVDGEAGDEVAGATASSTRFGAGVLGQDRRGAVERGRGDGVWRVGPGRVALVPRAWRDAFYPAQPFVGPVSFVPSFPIGQEWILSMAIFKGSVGNIGVISILGREVCPADSKLIKC